MDRFSSRDISQLTSVSCDPILAMNLILRPSSSSSLHFIRLHRLCNGCSRISIQLSAPSANHLKCWREINCTSFSFSFRNKKRRTGALYCLVLCRSVPQLKILLSRRSVTGTEIDSRTWYGHFLYSDTPKYRLVASNATAIKSLFLPPEDKKMIWEQLLRITDSLEGEMIRTWMKWNKQQKATNQRERQVHESIILSLK